MRFQQKTGEPPIPASLRIHFVSHASLMVARKPTIEIRSLGSKKCFNLRLGSLQHLRYIARHCTVILRWVVSWPICLIINGTNIVAFAPFAILAKPVLSPYAETAELRHQRSAVWTNPEGSINEQRRGISCLGRDWWMHISLNLFVSYCYNLP